MKNMASKWKPVIYESEKAYWCIFRELCKGCGLCIEKCPTHVIERSEQLAFNGIPSVQARIEGCIVCGNCETVCPDTAIAIHRKKKTNRLSEVSSKKGRSKPALENHHCCGSQFLL